MSWASLLHFPPIPDVPAFARGRSYAVVMAAHLGSAAEGASLLAPLRQLGPERDTFATVPPVVLGDLAMDPLDPVPFQSTSALLDELPPAAIEAVLAAAGPESGRGPTVSMLQLRQMGGALARATPGAGARATLPGDVSMFALGAVFDEPMREAVDTALADVDSALQPYRAGYYANFVEEPADASAFFDPAAWARLRAVAGGAASATPAGAPRVTRRPPPRPAGPVPRAPRAPARRGRGPPAAPLRPPPVDARPPGPVPRPDHGAAPRAPPPPDPPLAR